MRLIRAALLNIYDHGGDLQEKTIRISNSISITYRMYDIDMSLKFVGYEPLLSNTNYLIRHLFLSNKSKN